MRSFYFLILALFPITATFAIDDWPLSNPINEEEALTLRRIADFWQEGEYTIAKSQMEEFLAEFPESGYIDPIRACLGDLLLREKNYSGALSAYSALTSSALKEKTFLKRIQCLYCLEWYATLADECEHFLENTPENEAKIQATYYLAIALYQQCLNAKKHPEILLKLAHRVEPYFQTLMHSDLSIEAAAAFAHLCCILKEYEKAAEMYLSFAKRAPDIAEEMLFQAAQIQTEYDKNLALQSYAVITKQGGKKAAEAAYHHLAISFEMGEFQKIIENQSAILESLSNDRKPLAHFFFGRSYLALSQYNEAISECSSFLENAQSEETEAIRFGLLTLIEAAKHSKDVETLDTALAKLSSIDPTGEHTARSRLLRAMLLKNLGRFDEARQEFDHLFSKCPEFPDQMAAKIEEIDLEFTSLSLDSCRKKAKAFLSKCTDTEWEAPTWRYLLAASSRFAADQPRNKEMQERFVSDLKAALQKKNLFPLTEENDWKFFLSQSLFNLNNMQDATSILSSILQKDHAPFSQEANATLLLGIVHRDLTKDLASFCRLAEEGIAKKQTIMDEGILHIALFNAYLEQNLIEKSASHLYMAFTLGSEVSLENLVWLGEWHFNLEDKAKATHLFSSLLEKTNDPHLLETAHYRLGSLSHQVEEFEKNLALYEKDPSFEWRWEEESRLTLAKIHQEKGNLTRAIDLLDSIIGHATVIHSKAMAEAFFERAMISFEKLTKWLPDDPDFMNAATELKTLILQKNLLFEPIHLEAALTYVDLFEKTSLDGDKKRLSLLEKTKSDFETEDDILSKNYHLARAKYPSQNEIYENYMRFLDSEILLTKSRLSEDPLQQKQLQAKAKDLLLQIKSSVSSTLLKRVQSRLQDELQIQ